MREGSVITGFYGVCHYTRQLHIALSQVGIVGRTGAAKSSHCIVANCPETGGKVPKIYWICPEFSLCCHHSTSLRIMHIRGVAQP